MVQVRRSQATLSTGALCCGANEYEFVRGWSITLTTSVNALAAFWESFITFDLSFPVLNSVGLLLASLSAYLHVMQPRCDLLGYTDPFISLESLLTLALTFPPTKFRALIEECIHTGTANDEYRHLADI